MQQGYRQPAQRPAGSNQPSSRSTALAIQGAGTDSRDVSMSLERAAKEAHLVTPTSVVASIPEGCEVALSTVLIDIARETYDVGGGKKGLAKVALDRIAAAAGISWDPHLSGRIDDGSDPYYCAWRAVGTLRHLDGTEVTIDASKEMDLRDGSPQIEALYARAQNGRKDPTNQIREMRLHIMAHAESKARLRAIRSIGVRSSYEERELEKPFVVARLMFTGRSEDPELRAEFARMTAAAMIGGRRALYGDRPAGQVPVVHAAPARPTPQLSPPPIGGSRFDDEDDVHPSREPIRGQSTPRPQPALDDRTVESDSPTNDAARARSGVTIPGGNEKGTPIEDASDRSLEYWEERISKAVADGSSRYPDKDREIVGAMRAEIAARRNGR